MGQYFKILNKTKKEYINNNPFRHGSKFFEIIRSSYQAVFCLCLLLRQGDTKKGDLSSGGGDYASLLWNDYVRPQSDKIRQLINGGMEADEAYDKINTSIKDNAPKELWEYLGRWVGDEIAIVGDYDESEWEKEYKDASYTDISDKVIPMLEYIKKHFEITSKDIIVNMHPDMVITG